MTRVLLVRLSAMGDLMQSLGPVQALQARCPELQLTVCTQSTFAPLLQQLPGLPVVEHDRRGGLGALLDTRRRLRRGSFDVAIDLQGNWKSALVARLAGARQVLGAAGPWRQEPRSRWLLHRALPVAGPRHPALVAWTLVRELAPDVALAPPRLRATPAEVQAAAEAVRAAGVSAGRPFRVVVCGRPDDPRSLHPRQVARLAARDGPPVLLLAGPAERAVALPAGLPAWRQGAGELRLLVGLGVLLQQVGGEVFGPDQGATHVLAACGAATTVAFGPQDPACTAPLAARVLQHAAPPPCMPCRSRRCTRPEGPVCMDFAFDAGRAVAPPTWSPPCG